MIALGSAGALDWFAPAHPMPAIQSMALPAWALRSRLQLDGEPDCRMTC